METIFTFRNIHSTDALRNHTIEKMEKLKKYLVKPVSAHVMFHIERHEQIAEITLSANGHTYVGIGKSDDMYPSIDDAIRKLLTQVKRDRDRIKQHKGE
ncbi:MAG: ribosomal subunit interface protein [Deltaproteobacteria bacterium RIFCSPLOWO2_02_FULL_44_10]|nr:MAG: ribosomal subunit interface protein [Deltaproteobacteria bacterium RIFCSPHIGHO2_02_FULL_44_16]OGQ47036.1 MAG: ribosomal subunit interface protein [Deltaproteobacteria bacterium RIFCSPLOWO2_02_FULL_44_10]